MPSLSATSPASLVRIEAAALNALAERLDGPDAERFSSMLALLEGCVRQGRRVVLTGMGKSGLIARKIAATLTSLSVPSGFLHPAEALHGDLGLLSAGDVLLALSYSGETAEILTLLAAVRRLGVTLLGFTGCPSSSLARESTLWLDVSVMQEACTHQLAPTASTTTMLALGDAVAVLLSQRLGFVPQLFADLHPGGSLGRRLTPVRELAHLGTEMPRVPPDASMTAVIHEMSAKRLGMTTIQDAKGRLLGVLSDGDLRRLFEREGPEAFLHVANEVMNAKPLAVKATVLALEALALMEEKKITALVLTDDGSSHGVTLGVVHLHDVIEAVTGNQA